MENVKKLGTVDSLLLCEYLLQVGGAMSHLKLQKVLYYAQSIHLAYFDAPLIDDDFQAWLHGPVSRKVYDQLKDKSKLYTEVAYNPLEWGANTPDVQLKGLLTNDQIEILNEVIEGYGKMSASQLENLSHSEYPWINARIGYGIEDRCEVIIKKEVMASFYKAQIYNGA
jgi:uncharacterized phage-associated protein